MQDRDYHTLMSDTFSIDIVLFFGVSILSISYLYRDTFSPFIQIYLHLYNYNS